MAFFCRNLRGAATSQGCKFSAVLHSRNLLHENLLLQKTTQFAHPSIICNYFATKVPKKSVATNRKKVCVYRSHKTGRKKKTNLLAPKKSKKSSTLKKTIAKKGKLVPRKIKITANRMVTALTKRKRLATKKKLRQISGSIKNAKKSIKKAKKSIKKAKKSIKNTRKMTAIRKLQSKGTKTKTMLKRSLSPKVFSGVRPRRPKLSDSKKRKVTRIKKQLSKKQQQQKMESQSAKRAEKLHLKKGLITESFSNNEARIEWYRKLKSSSADEAFRKKWENRTNRALNKLEQKKNSKKVYRASMRSLVKMHNPTMDVSSLSPDELKQKYEELKQKANHASDFKRAQALQKSLEKKGKCQEIIQNYSPEQLVAWWQEQKDALDLQKGHKIAKREFNKGNLFFAPTLAPERLILLWYRDRKRRNTKKSVATNKVNYA